MNKPNLILHCGARRISREKLATITAPEHTDTWKPMPHIRLVEEIERSLRNSHMTILDESYGVTIDNERMFGLLHIGREGFEQNNEYAYVIGVRGSINKSLSQGLAVGGSVFVCDNLAFSSEIVFKRKSTKNVMDDLPLMVDTAIGQLAQRWNDQATRYETYKRTEIKDRDVAHLLMEMAEDVFPSQKLMDIYHEFKAPRHVEFGKENLWAMFNAVTEFLKPRGEQSKASGLWTLPARTGRLHKICDDFAGLEINTKITAVQIQPEPVLGVRGVIQQ